MNVVKMREVADSLLDKGKYEDAYYVFNEIYNRIWLALGTVQNGLNEFSQSFIGYSYKTNFDFRNSYTIKAADNVCQKWFDLDLNQTLNELTFTTYGHLQSICYSSTLISNLQSDLVYNEFLVLHTLILEAESENWIKSLFKIVTPQMEGNYLKKIRSNLTEDNLKEH